jgi:raffinose/stachyose/melibiose transport system substrate-binding protein
MKKAKLITLLLIVMMVVPMGIGLTNAQGEKVKLVFWSMWNENEPQAQVLQALIKDFEAQNPNITIEAQWNGRQNQTLARTALSAGQQIDLIDQDADPLAGGLVNEGMAYPLTEFLDEKALDEDVPIRQVFLPGMLELFAVDGTVYEWPYIFNTSQFWYNKNAFSEAGIEQPPATWDEFMTACQKLNDAGYAPIAAESDIQFYQIDYLTYQIERYKGLGFLRQTMEDKTGEMWRDPVYLQAAQNMRDLWDKGCIPAETKGYLWPAGQQTLGVGVSAMELVGSWLPTELKDVVKDSFEWGAFNFPAMPDGVGKQGDLMIYLLSFMIVKDSSHPSEAFEFLRFIMTKDNQQKMTNEAFVGVTRVGVPWAPIIQDGATAASNATAIFGMVDGATALYPEFVNNILQVNWSKLFLGDLKPEEFVDKMATDAQDYWAKQAG